MGRFATTFFLPLPPRSALWDDGPARKCGPGTQRQITGVPPVLMVRSLRSQRPMPRRLDNVAERSRDSCGPLAPTDNRLHFNSCGVANARKKHRFAGPGSDGTVEVVVWGISRDQDLRTAAVLTTRMGYGSQASRNPRTKQMLDSLDDPSDGSPGHLE